MIGFEKDAAAPAERNGELTVTLSVNDPECVQELLQYAEGPSRDQFAACALRVGILALKQARGQIDGDTLRREGDHLLTSMKNVLTHQLDKMNGQLAQALKDYFDPQSGRFHERVQSLVKKDGELEIALRRLIGTDDSELCKTLAQHVGQDSALMKILSPKESDGILKSLTDAMNKELLLQRECVLREFSMDNEQSALKRLVATLTTNHGDLGKALQDKIDTVMKEFSLDKEDSALKRMTDGVTAATKSINTHLTLDDENSALSRLQRELKKVLDETAKVNQEFQKEVRETLVELRTRRAAASRSPEHGREFELELFDVLTRMAGADLAELTKDKVGLIKNRKVGDVVIEIGPDAVAAGAKIVFEAKDEVKYSLAAARAEIEDAKKNRGAKIGIFVFAKRNAPPDAEPFRREGDNIFLVWDTEDPATDIHLRSGLELARALCTRQIRQRETEAIDLIAFEKAVLEIEKQIKAMDEINTWSDTIARSSEKIKEQLGKSKESIDRQIKCLNNVRSDLKDHLAAQDSAT